MKLSPRTRTIVVAVSRVSLLFYVVGTLVYMEVRLLETSAPHLWERVAMVVILGFLAVAVTAVIMQVRETRALLKTNADLLDRVSRLHDATAEVSIAARQELATWLHGEAQAKLLDMARTIREEIEKTTMEVASNFTGSAVATDSREGLHRRCSDLNVRVAEAIEAFNDSVLRRQAHTLFPPLLSISLEYALLDLLEGRASLDIDPALTLEHSKNVIRSGSTGVVSGESLQSTFLNAAKSRLLVPSDIRYVVYRVVEEAVNNAAKHRAKNVEVSVRVDGGDMVCEVSNDGDPLPRSISPKFGLLQVDALVSRLHGKWTLQSKNDRTVLRVVLPMGKTRADFFLTKEIWGDER